MRSRPVIRPISSAMYSELRRMLSMHRSIFSGGISRAELLTASARSRIAFTGDWSS